MLGVGVLSLALVLGGSVSVASADAGTLTATDVFGALGSEASLEAACVAATGGSCVVALGIGAALVGAGWVFDNRDQVYSAIQAVWDGLTGAQAQELQSNIQANGGQIVQPSASLQQALTYDVSNVAVSGGYVTQAFTATGGWARSGSYLYKSLAAGATVVRAAEWQVTVPEAATQWYVNDPSSGANGTNGNAFVGSIDLAAGTVSGTSNVTEVWTLTDTTSGTHMSWTSNSGNVPLMWETGSFPTAANDILSLTVDLTNAGSSAVTYGLYAGAGAAMNLENPNTTDSWAAPSILDGGGSGSLQISNYTVPGTFTPGAAVPAIINPPNTIDQLVGANDGTTVTDVQGNSTTLGANTATGSVGLLGGILAGVLALPGDIGNLFVPTAADEGALEARWNALATSFSSVVPFSYIIDIDQALTSYFGSVGTSPMSYSFPWSFTPQGGSAESWTWAVNLADQFNILPTIRLFSSFVLYGLLFLFGFTEARKWFGSGGAE